MAQFLLVSINASYSHTNLAVRSIKEYVKNDIEFGEWTINQPVGEVLRGIASFEPRFVMFSTYIWNAEFVAKIIPDVKKILPDCVVCAGGPEFGFYAEGYLEKLSALDFVIKGEGEETVRELVEKVMRLDAAVEDNCAAVNSGTAAGNDCTAVNSGAVAGNDCAAVNAGTAAGNESAAVNADAAAGNESTVVNVGTVAGNDCAAVNAGAMSGNLGAATSAFNGQMSLSQLLSDISGLYFRGQDGKIVFTGERDLICDLSSLAFPYPSITDPDNRIYYYESSRGCPFSCSYCMSSLDRRVRFMPLERVFADLQRFMDANVKLVKFVDRTYNLQPERYIKIWQYILEHHNGKTMFHFEIEAEYLSEEALEFLQGVPEGVMQFEIGVQSTNKKTLRAISRSENVEKLAQNIRRIPRTIHQHLDLIAGLPYEDLQSFGKSFDDVMALKPDALQLGFLKVLHGTIMEDYAKANGWKWMENPVYETFSTPYMSYQDILFLKDLEVMVDAYYNSGTFPTVMKFVERKVGYWEFFCRMVRLGRSGGVFEAARRETFWFQFLAENVAVVNVGGVVNQSNGAVNGSETFVDQGMAEVNGSDAEVNSLVLYDLLRYDFIRTGKKGGFPQWYVHNYSKDEHRQFLEQNGGVTNARLDFAYSDFEVFKYNPECDEPEKESGEFKLLFKYKRK